MLLTAALEASPSSTGRREEAEQGLDRRDRVEARGLVRHRNGVGGWRRIWVMGWRAVAAAGEDP